MGSVSRRVAYLRVLESMRPVRIDTFFYGQNCFSKCVAELDLNEHGVGGGLLNNLLFPISTYTVHCTGGRGNNKDFAITLLTKNVEVTVEGNLKLTTLL